ncbi:MAG: energy transducer TonB [Candidatus Coatesbacteria bacterium]|nr:energy transducer TonB [Candidatus Coatesbacteria bacterium]
MRAKSDRLHLIYGLAVSIAVHLLAVAFIPGPAPVQDADSREELIQIDLLPLDYGVLGYEAAAMGVSKKEAELLSQLSADSLAFAQQLPLGIFTREPRADTAENDMRIDADDLPDRRLPEMVEKTLDRLARSRREIGRTGSEERKPWMPAPSKPKEKVHLPETVAPGAAAAPTERSVVNVGSIVGPVSARQVVFWPPRDEIKITTPGNVRIKFWVQPDGTVSRIIFEQKLDATLDDYSARYVRALRFEPLPEGKDYLEWGTIPIAFRPE